MDLKRFISQDKIYPFSQNYLKICCDGDDGSLFIVKTNLLQSNSVQLLKMDNNCRIIAHKLLIGLSQHRSSLQRKDIDDI